MMRHFILLTLSVAVVYGQCPDGWIHHGQSCYRLRFDTETWIDAKVVCELDGAYLAEIGDEKENTFIHGLVTDNKGIWIGGTDLSTEGEWIWINSHSDMTYTKWRPTEPNNSGHDENCLEMDTHGLWNDRPCHYIQKYVCEKTLQNQEIIG
ncbi:low affinity immunoglobulin epsilon Fc receptor-like [Ruditapes philippinarum]|uniref:low affinity immunoglobulin epsilon Fc receptor-like n=1 Tax=Ruditapes philippinarum TaxID=129788 RepID=UPI00295C04F9|nr:low affinity immunoglobulin epsilon Fc receptor-like [Ruditapes philippinarum]